MFIHFYTVSMQYACLPSRSAILAYNCSLMHENGCRWQSTSQKNFAQDIHPIGGVLQRNYQLALFAQKKVQFSSANIVNNTMHNCNV